MDDILLPGENEVESSDSKRVVMILHIETEEGYEVDLIRDSISPDYFTHLYFPKLRREAHARFSGYGPDSTKYYRFTLDGITIEDYLVRVKYDFVTDGGWFEERSTLPENV